MPQTEEKQRQKTQHRKLKTVACYMTQLMRND